MGLTREKGKKEKKAGSFHWGRRKNGTDSKQVKKRPLNHQKVISARKISKTQGRGSRELAKALHKSFQKRTISSAFIAREGVQTHIECPIPTRGQGKKNPTPTACQRKEKQKRRYWHQINKNQPIHACDAPTRSLCKGQEKTSSTEEASRWCIRNMSLSTQRCQVAYGKSAGSIQGGNLRATGGEWVSRAGKAD